MKLILRNDTNQPNIPSVKQFQQWIDKTVKIVSNKISKDCHEICIAIVDNATSAQLNETYRHKTGPTNVLSFPYQAIPGIKQVSLGDLAICAALVEEEAITQGKSAISHWAHLTIHGILHLCGYDHIIDEEAAIMEALEISLLKQLDFEDP